MGMLSALQNALGLGDDSGTKAGEKKRADILAARSIQASAKLQRLLRRDRSAQEAWEYFAELCAGPDMNEFHCSIMLTATTSPEQVQEVVDMAGRVGVRPNAAVYTALHRAYVRLDELPSAMQVLQRGRVEGLVDGALLGGITMNTLKQMLKLGQPGRDQAWQYFRHMQKIDAANVRHYTKMLQTCNEESEIDCLMAELDESSIRPNAAIFTTLHKVYVRLNLFGKAGNVLKTAQHKGLLDISDTDKSKPFVIRILDNSTLSAIATNTLRGLHKRADAEAYFRAICDAGVASAVHYGVMIDRCEDLESVHQWTAQMEKQRVARDEHTWTILHKVLSRLSDFDGAVSSLQKGLRAQHITNEAAGSTITSSLSEMVRHQDVTRAWSFFRAVQRGGLVSHYQFNLMLALCTTRATVMELVGQMEEANIAWDAVTYTSLHAALVRCGEHAEAVAVLRRGRDCGLVDDDAASIAATGVLKHIVHNDGAAARVDRAAAARDYCSDLRVAGLADEFHYCFLLRHCCPSQRDLQSVVAELEEAQLPHSFHLYASLHRAYSRFKMENEAAAALERLQHIFASLHAAREAKIDEYNIVMHTCEDTASVKLVLRQMEEAGIPYDPATFMTCFKVFSRSGEYDKAVKVLAAAQQEGILDATRVRKTTSSALRQMSKRHQTANRKLFLAALARHGMMDH